MKQIIIEGLQDYYYADIEGNIYSYYTKSMKKLSYDIDKDGYYRVSLQHKDGSRHSYRVNRLIALTYLNNPNNYPVVNHIDSNKQNNNINNLEWTTISENTRLGYKNNNYHFVKKIGVFKDEKLINIFNSIKECAVFYNITYFDISKIANRKIPIHKKGKIAGLDFRFINESVSTNHDECSDVD